jgi:hypothetical protein
MAPKTNFVRTDRRWDPLKTVPGSGFEKTLKIDEKTIGKSMVFDGLKPWKSIEKQMKTKCAIVHLRVVSIFLLIF